MDGDLQIAVLQQAQVLAGALGGLQDDLNAVQMGVDNAGDTANIHILAAAGGTGTGRDLYIVERGGAVAIVIGGLFAGVLTAAGSHGHDHQKSKK